MVGVETRDVGAVGVDLGRPVGHPLGHRLGHARRLLDPDGGHRPEALDLGRLAQDGIAVRRQGQETVDGQLHADLLVADDRWEEFQSVFELRVEVLLGEGQLGRGERRGLDRRDVIGLHEDRPMRVRADLEASPMLALVHVGVHVADDREGHLAGGVLEDRHRPDVDHLVDRRRERDRRAGHPRDARAPDATRDDDHVCPDVAPVRSDAGDPPLHDIDAGDLGLRGDDQGAHVLCGLAHQRAGLERIHDADAWRVEARQDHGLIDEGHHRLDLCRGDQPDALDAPRRRCRHAPLQLLDAFRRASHLDTAALGKDAEFLVLPDAVDRESGHLLGVVGQEDEVRGVTSRTARAGQRALLDEHDVAPAEPGQVVGHAVADDPGADDNDPRSIW